MDVNETDEPLSNADLRRIASQYSAMVSLLTDRIDRAVLEAGTGNLKIVANVAVGFDNIDVPAATDNHVMATNTPGVVTDTTADFAFTLMVSIARRVCEADAFLRAGHYHGWGIMMLLGEDIHRNTLGLAGFGRIGRAMARRAAGFDMQVLFYDPIVQESDETRALGVRKVDLETLLRESDFVSIHTPLTPETTHLIGAEQLRMMKSTAFLINTSRGPVVDESALAGALRAQTIKGAALDVYENEPLVHSGLLEMDNVILAPHIASASVATRTRMAVMAAENVIAALSGGRPPALLNPEVLNS